MLEACQKILFIASDVHKFKHCRVPVVLAAQAQGFEVLVALPAHATDLLANAEFPITTIQLDSRTMGIKDQLQTLRSLYQLIKKTKPHYIFLDGIKTTLLGGLAARFLGVNKVVGLLTGLGYLFTTQSCKAILMRTITKLGLRYAFSKKQYQLAFHNQDDRELFLKQKIIAKSQAVIINGSGVDIKKFTTRDVTNDVVTIMMIARLLKNKGINEFLAAAERIQQHHPQQKVRFVVVGDIDANNPDAISSEELHYFIRTNLIEWLGYQDNIHTLLPNADIICLPSYREGLPRVLVEAAACGKPIVTTDVPGCRAIVRHQYNGLTVPVKNATALAAALLELIQNPATRKTMGQRGRQLVEEQFSMEKIIKETLSVIRGTQ